MFILLDAFVGFTERRGLQQGRYPHPSASALPLASATPNPVLIRNDKILRDNAGGLCPTASPRRPPETTLCAFRCPVGVCDAALLALRYCMVWCMVCLVGLAVPLCVCKRGWAKRRNNPFGVQAIVLFFNVRYCVLGAVPMVGRRLRLSVPWSPKMTLREEGRPMVPATPRAF